MRNLISRGGIGLLVVVLLAALGAAAAVGMTAHAASTAKVTVVEREYSIKLSKRSLKTGKTTFLVENKGKIAHAFEIRGPGVAGKRIVGTIAPGAAKKLTVKLRAGTYKLFCPIHLAVGMKTQVTVGHAAATTSTGGTTTSGTTTGGGGWG